MPWPAPSRPCWKAIRADACRPSCSPCPANPVTRHPGGDPTADGIRKLGRRIAGFGLSRVQLTLCRAVGAKHLLRVPPQPLYHLGSAAFGARYTPLGGPAGLYLAGDQPTAYAELQHLFCDPSGRLLPLRPQDPVMTLYVEAEVSGVLDLTEQRVRRALGVTRAGITGEWRMQMDRYLAGSGAMPLAQQIGHAAHATGRVRGRLLSVRAVERRPLPDRLSGPARCRGR